MSSDRPAKRVRQACEPCRWELFHYHNAESPFLMQSQSQEVEMSRRKASMLSLLATEAAMPLFRWARRWKSVCQKCNYPCSKPHIKSSTTISSCSRQATSFGTGTVPLKYSLVWYSDNSQEDRVRLLEAQLSDVVSGRVPVAVGEQSPLRSHYTTPQQHVPQVTITPQLRYVDLSLDVSTDE